MYVGAPFDESGGSKTGSVSIYTEVSNDSWSLLDRITPSDGNAGDQFGVSLDVDDSSTFIIGSNVSIIVHLAFSLRHLSLKHWSCP